MFRYVKCTHNVNHNSSVLLSSIRCLHKSTRIKQSSASTTNIESNNSSIKDEKSSRTNLFNSSINNNNNNNNNNIFIHRLPESTAEQSPLLVSLHSRLNLSSKFKLSTLSQCLNLLKPNTKESEGLANNYGLNILGKTLLSYYVSEYLLINYPRLPMTIHNHSIDAYMGTKTLSEIGRSWGIEVDSISKIDKFLGQESEFIKYGRLRYLNNENKEVNKNFQVSGIEEIIDPVTKLNKEDIAYASAVRSIIGGIYTHCGEDVAKQFIKDHILSRYINFEKMFEFNKPISELIRLCDKLQFKEPLTIRLIAETGRLSAHPQYLAGCFIGNEKLGEGIGSSLKEAQIRSSINSLLSYYLYSPINQEGDKIKLPSDENYKFEGIIDIGDVAI
ncbi:MRPL3 [Candida pseudojiufengensis]|uniref:MRPL3 n=1 Tax=Candida pseudojiufengensis TaxID=497109 RepID=UPI0022245FEA|nr:MRPL3 [Candida pseudojiufengensis]KAI5964749.1 MRPL3 [Candida pseudojiufengensis]